MPWDRTPRQGGPPGLSRSDSQAQVATELTLKHWQVKVEEFRD